MNSNNYEDSKLQNRIIDIYLSSDPEKKCAMVKQLYDSRNAKETYATSRDHNLRELEISYIKKNINPGKILDIGCGNGYTLLSLARDMEGDYYGLDFSSEMIKGAYYMLSQEKEHLKAYPNFMEHDVRLLPFPENYFDCVISERCLLNLPDRESQYSTIKEVYRVLRDGGTFIMVEGSQEGLVNLNTLRNCLGLSDIQSVDKSNFSSLKFNEEQLMKAISYGFEIENIHHFSLYYLISRVVHPAVIYPDEPKFDAKINDIARIICELCPDAGNYGHIVGYVLRAVKPTI